MRGEIIRPKDSAKIRHLKRERKGTGEGWGPLNGKE